MSTPTIFEDGENLQASIGKAVAEKKSLLCFITNEDDNSKQWQDVLLNTGIRQRLLANTVALKLTAGSEQAGFLNAVCEIKSVPAIIVIQNGQVVANLQNESSRHVQVQQYLSDAYGTSDGPEVSKDAESSKAVKVHHIEFSSSSGRMRLPNNAYDKLRELSEQYKQKGIEGLALLKIQLRLLASLDSDGQPSFVPNVSTASRETPVLTESIMSRLLNTPASRLQVETPPTSTSSWSFTSSQPATTNPSTAYPSSQSTTSSSPSTNRPPTTSTQSQRAAYVESRKAAEAERTRIKEQIEADRKARREAERKEREESAATRRRTELLELRKANSTTSNPKASDIRIQIRTFDGSTIRTSFPAEATISKDVRPWIDIEVKKTGSSQPYNLKLVLTPLPNRSIEAGEEESGLSDVEGIRGSATLIMVPVQGFVESYSGNGGVIQGIVGTGAGLVGTAANMAFGALGRLWVSTPAAPATPPTQSETVQGHTLGSSSSKAKARTLADQRRDEHDEQQKTGSLYNGMGLNVQPRKDEDKKD